MQQFLAGMAIGSIVTLAGAVFWHYHITADLRGALELWRKAENKYYSRLLNIVRHLDGQKSGTARLVVKMARGEQS